MTIQRGLERRNWRLVVAGVGAVTLVAAGLIVLRQSRSEPEAPGGPPRARLISAEQYQNVLHDVFGADVRLDIGLPPPPRRHGLLSLGAVEVVATPGFVSQFDRAAREVAVQIVEERSRATLIPCALRVASEPDDACSAEFFARVGRYLFRRPLSERETSLLVTAAREATTTSGDFYAGLAHGLSTMLVSPRFLYFVELTEPDPARPGRYRLDAWSKATRLSLFLWNSVPDDALLVAAENGELHEKAGLERQVKRMLAAPQRVERGARAFFSDLLLLDRFDALAKDPVIYPSFTLAAARSAREQILRLIVDQLLVREGDYRDLFTTHRTFIDSVLAPLYRVPAHGEQWMHVTLDKQRGAGVLTTLGFLAAHSHPGRSSPTLRGTAIREALLCQEVPDPPPNVNFTAFEGSLETMKTARERLAAHNTDAVCAGCHKITDPIGLALENFDGAGLFRAAEQGAAIDASGDLDGQPFADAAGLGQAMHDHRALASCLVNRLYSYAVGRAAITADRPWLAFAVRRFAKDEYRYPELLRRIATSGAFYAVTADRPSNLADEH